jgi:hypothetical protein
MIRRFLIVLAVSSIGAACSSAPTSTTTTLAPPPSTSPTTTSSTTPEPTTTTVPAAVGEIHAALDGYAAALAGGDGSAALEYVDDGTLELFDDLLLLAASPIHVDQLDYLDAFLVLRLRHRFSAAELDDMTAADVFLTTVDGDLVFPAADQIEFDAINLIGDEATGEIGGSPAMWFAFEQGRWKLALGRTFDEYAQVLSLTIEAAASQAAGEGATPAEALLFFVSTLEGADVDQGLLAGPAEG